jgi:hypothetical protein
LQECWIALGQAISMGQIHVTTLHNQPSRFPSVKFILLGRSETLTQLYVLGFRSASPLSSGKNTSYRQVHAEGGFLKHQAVSFFEVYKQGDFVKQKLRGAIALSSTLNMSLAVMKSLNTCYR